MGRRWMVLLVKLVKNSVDSGETASLCLTSSSRSELPPAAVETSFKMRSSWGNTTPWLTPYPACTTMAIPLSSHNDQNGSQYSSKRGGVPAWRMKPGQNVPAKPWSAIHSRSATVDSMSVHGPMAPVMRNRSLANPKVSAAHLFQARAPASHTSKGYVRLVALWKR